MNKKALYSILSTIVAMIVLSVSLVFAIGPRVSADNGEWRVGVLDKEEYFDISFESILGDLDPITGDFEEIRVYTLNGLSDEGRDYADQYNELHLVIPENVVTIGSSAFGGRSSLASVILPDGLKTIRDNAFGGCYNLKVFIPNSVETVGQAAFANVMITYRATDDLFPVGWNFWWNSYPAVVAPGLTTPLVDPYNRIPLFNRPNYSFTEDYFACETDGKLVYQRVLNAEDEPEDAYAIVGYVGNLSTIDIPREFNDMPVTTIGAHAFDTWEYGRKSSDENGVFHVDNYYNHLTSIKIPDSITTIGDFAFAGVSGLTDMVIPNSVENMGGAVFTGCENLTTIHCEADEQPAGRNEYWNVDSTGWNYDNTNWIAREYRIDITAKVEYGSHYTVVFETNGGSTVAAQEVIYNGNVITPETTKEGYTFKGWFIGDEEYNFATPVTEDVTLTAKWEAVQTQPEQPEPETPAEENTEVNNQNNTGVIWGIAGTSAGILIIAGIVVGVVITKRRRK